MRHILRALSLLPILVTSQCASQAGDYSSLQDSQTVAAPGERRGADGLRGLADQVMRPVVAQDGIPGAIVGISLRGARHYFTYSDGGEGFGPDAIVEIGSITKVFTAALLAEAIQDGSIRPDASIQTYLPQTRLQGCAQAVTPMELASFSSGMPSLPSDAPRRLDERDLGNYTADDFLHWVGQWSPTGDGGCRLPAPYLYSNASVGLLGPILANVTGVSWDRLVTERITGPLGMRHTAIAPRPEHRGQVVQGHGPRGRRVMPWPVFAWYAAGALRSTAPDMLNLGEAALGHPDTAGQTVPPALTRALRLSMTPVYQPDGKPFQQAMAWEIQAANPAGGGVIAMKDGGTDGFNSVLLVDAAKDAVVFIVANKARSGIPRAGLNLMRRLP